VRGLERRVLLIGGLEEFLNAHWMERRVQQTETKMLIECMCAPGIVLEEFASCLHTLDMSVDP
jgi:predicted cupin superfamily sugar epimerase